MSSNNNTAIARRVTPEIIKQRVEDVVAVTRNPVRSILELQQAYEQLNGKCNLLTPITHPNDIQPLHRVSLSVVVLSPDVKGSDCYSAPAFHENGECSLSKNGLLKLMQAAGLSVVGTQKVDDGSEQFYSAYNVSVYGRDLRGIWRTVSKDGRCDFRQGSQMIRGWGEKQLSAARAHIDSRAETKAMSKCIREFLAIQGKYKVEQLALPFVVPVLVADPDPNHPVDRAWLLNQGNARADRLFGAPPAATEEVREVKTVSPPPPVKTSAPPPVGSSAPDDDDDEAGPDDDQLGLLDDVTEESGVKICGCPCACQAEVKEETATATETTFGSIRCTRCAPGKGFDYGRHKDLKTLELAKYPVWTADFVKQQLEKKAAKAAGR